MSYFENTLILYLEINKVVRGTDEVQERPGWAVLCYDLEKLLHRSRMSQALREHGDPMKG